jgi:hypothetical protein
VVVALKDEVHKNKASWLLGNKMNKTYVITRTITWSLICLVAVVSLETMVQKLAFATVWAFFIWQGYSWYKKLSVE